MGAALVGGVVTPGREAEFLWYWRGHKSWGVRVGPCLCRWWLGFMASFGGFGSLTAALTVLALGAKDLHQGW